MPSADPGAPLVRPADVERWLAELGLEPLERADRDGIASWDLVLDGRRRFDLRVTVILDPALAIIVLGALRPADQRHVPQVVPEAAALERRVPVREVQRRRGRAAAPRGRGPDRRRRRRPAWAWRWPGSSASPTACSTNRRTGSGSAAGAPDQCGRTSRNAGFLDRYEARLPELLDGMSATAPGPSRLLLALVVGDRPAARRRRSAPVAEVRAATPDLTIVSDARYDVQPDQQPRPGDARPDADEPPQGHDDQALLLRSRRSSPSCPGVSGYKFTWAGAGTPERPRRRRRPRTTRSSSSTSASRLYSGKTATLHAPLRPRRQGRQGDARRPRSAIRSCRSRSGRSPPTTRRAARSRSSSRPASRSRSRPGDIPAPTTDSNGPDRLPDRRARQAADVLRVPRRRPARRLRRAARLSPIVRGKPAELTIRSWPDDPAWDERVGGLVERALPVLGDADRPALAARGRRSPCRRRSAARPAATPGCSTRRQGRVEVAYYADRLRGPPRGGARLVQRRAPRRPLGERGVRVVLRPRGRRRRSRSRPSATS